MAQCTHCAVYSFFSVKDLKAVGNSLTLSSIKASASSHTNMDTTAWTLMSHNNRYYAKIVLAVSPGLRCTLVTQSDKESLDMLSSQGIWSRGIRNRMKQKIKNTLDTV